MPRAIRQSLISVEYTERTIPEYTYTMNNDSLVLARIYSSDWEAHLAQGVLEEHGIPSVLDNEIMNTTLPFGFNSIRLMVFSRDREAAEEVLGRMGD